MMVAGKTYKTALVVIPPEDTWDPIQAIREKHDRAFQRWMPHITLLYPFHPRPDFELAAARLTRACASIASFEVTLASFDVFRHSQQSYTLWLAPKPKEALIELQTALWRAFPDCDDVRRFAGGFVPHLSVGQLRGREQMQQFVAALSRDWETVTFEVSVVSLIWREDPPHDIFRVAQTSVLGTA